MIGASKILTVSYGTFSCTLEGFDDPFNTMRAIAEYFRDLAAEDRYFGAEPPTPDAATLHRIAEREINRRVETNIQQNGVILRASDIEVSKPAPVAAPAVLPAVAALAEPNASQPVQARDDSIAARLIRLREAQAEAERAAVMARPAAETVDEDIEPAPQIPTDTWALDAADPDTDQAARRDDEDTLASVLTDLAEPAAADLPADAFMADEPAIDALAGWPVVDEVTLTDDEAQDALISAVRFQTESTPAKAAPDADIGPVTPSVATPVSKTADKADKAVLRATPGAMIDPDGDDDFDTASVSQPVMTPAVTPAVTPVWAAPEAMTGADVDAPAPTEVFTKLAPALVEPQAPEAAEVSTPQDGSAPTASEVQVAERLQRARARVIKIRRIDVGTAAAPAETPIEAAATPHAQTETRTTSDFVADDAATLEPPEQVGSALSPEAEAELQRELADFEATLAPGSDGAPNSDPQKFSAPKPADQSAADDAVNRLISQTNAAMEGPENKRRLSAIAHLKAAVAATFADRKSNAAPTQPGPAERMDPYRDDLNRVVRPRRPALVAPRAQEQGSVTPRPQIDPRPAPLVLVSGQRIDRPAVAASAPAGPVRPRRVTQDHLLADLKGAAAPQDDEAYDSELIADELTNIFADTSQPFAEFAERLGAVTMPDLIEAAAAYCALQLGRDQFTRPLLLQQIADLPRGDAFNREDCLRGFGTLLRDGRIEKIKRGQFKLSDQSRYLAEAKRQAG